MNEFCGRRSTSLSCIKSSSINKVTITLLRHYANVLSRSHLPSLINDNDDVATVSYDLDPSEITGLITTVEGRAALSTSILFSSSGPDGIPVIALRIEEFEDDVLYSINQSSKMVD